MATLNYTTRIPVTQTVAECQAMLARHGAGAVATRYESGQPIGLSFTLVTPHGQRTFSLPVDVAAVHRLLIGQVNTGKIVNKQKGGKAALATPEHAARVSWRVLKDWLEAQLAMIEAQMATLDQIMLPYLHVDGDRTLYEAYREREQLALESGGAV